MASSNNPKSPRQRMINLMYLVFIAMLALNVPAEVLDGFNLVEEGLQTTIQTSQDHNQIVIKDIEEMNLISPSKATDSYNKAMMFNEQSDKLFQHIESLKIQIAKKTDGENADLNNIKKQDALDAASAVMLGSDKQGEQLREFINEYKAVAVDLVKENTDKVKNLNARLSTDVPKKSRWDNKSWEESLFEEMPTSAAITLLTKIQSDIRASQGEVLSDLYTQIGKKDHKIGDLKAEVIPTSQYVMEGGTFEGRVIITAEDNTLEPEYKDPRIRPDGTFSTGAGAVGMNRVFSGSLDVISPDGKTKRSLTYSSEYNVVPKMSTIQIADANVLYAGEPTNLTISVPGMSNDELEPKSINGSLKKEGSFWVATAEKVGTNMKILVYKKGSTNVISEQEFRVRQAPKPTPYFEYNDAKGNQTRFTAGSRIPKTSMLTVPQISASRDDGLRETVYPVTGFSIVVFDGMGNRISEVSNNTQFTEKQKALIRQLGRGKSFLITDVKARAKDGTEMQLENALEVKLN